MKTFIVEGIKYERLSNGYEASNVVCSFEVRSDTARHALWEAIQAHKDELGKAHSLRVEQKRRAK